MPEWGTRRRNLKGPTDRVLIVGAGLAGLSAAMRLAGQGREVTVLEREGVPGGRAGLIERHTDAGTFRFDTGPTVLTMPELIDDAFDALGEHRSDWLHLLPLDPVYQARFADGSSLPVHADVERMSTAIRAFCGPVEAAAYQRYVEFLSELYDLELPRFIDRNFDSPVDLPGPELARLVAMGAMRRLSEVVNGTFADDRLRRLFSFQSLYAGVDPHRALAIYAVIAYMDSVAGVYFPKGGMHALPAAMAAAACRHGVDFRYHTTVARLERRGERVTAAITTEGERFPADTVILTPDLPVAQQDLLGIRLRRRRSSPSCYLLLTGTRGRQEGAHHTVSFGQAWAQTFEELDSGRLMSDPSILLSRPTATDPDLAPPGHESNYILFPTPNLDPRLPERIDWQRISGRYREHVTHTLQTRGLVAGVQDVVTEHAITPVEWEQQGMWHGTPFAAAHTFAQTGPFRASNRWGENVVFAGSGTTPGVGVPMVLISGRLAAERITGPDPNYRSRAWR